MNVNHEQIFCSLLSKVNFYSVFKFKEHCRLVNDASIEEIDFYLVTEGSLKLELNEQVVILNKNEFLILLDEKDLLKKVKYKSDNLELICGKSNMPNQVFCYLAKILPKFLHYKNKKNTSIMNIFEIIKYEISNNAVYSEPILSNLSKILFIEAARDYFDEGNLEVTFLKAFSSTKISKVLYALFEDLGADWTVDKMARIAGMSIASFHRHFKAILEVSPSAYIANARMLEAKSRIVNSEDSIATIANSLGYVTEEAFRKKFKQVIGRTPGEIRKEKSN